MDPWSRTPELLAELWRELRGAPGALRAPSAGRCDRVLRRCVEALAVPGALPRQLRGLLDVAEAACRGYPSAGPPLYLEKILFHLLRGCSRQSHPRSCWRAAELLRARLRAHARGAAPADLGSVVHGAFSLLWKAAPALGAPREEEEEEEEQEERQEEGRGVLLARLRALRFLLLLEEDGAALPPLQPPFLTTQTAQQAAAAAALCEEPSRAFLAQQLQLWLLRELREEPLSTQRCYCYLELSLQRCRLLCRCRQHPEALQSLRDAAELLGSSSSWGDFRDPLTLLESGVELSRGLSRGQPRVEPALGRALQALELRADAAERPLRLLAESCQFLAWALGELVQSSPRQPLAWGELLSIARFSQAHGRLLCSLLRTLPPEGEKQKLQVTQLLFHNLQLFTNLTYDTFHRPEELLTREPRPSPGELQGPCQGCVGWMLEALRGLPTADKPKYFGITASCVYKLAFAFFHRSQHRAAASVCQLFCQGLQDTLLDPYSCPQLPADKLHRCFRLRVESCRKLGELESAHRCLLEWLELLRGHPQELLLEPIALWARLRVDVAKQGAPELKPESLREALEGQGLEPGALVPLLLAELRAYKALRAGTGQQRARLLCQLLQLCPEHGDLRQHRALALLELAQLLCHHPFPQHTASSPLDAASQALRLLERVPRSCHSRAQLLDERAQALLWVGICSLEAQMEKSAQRDQGARGQGLKQEGEFHPNDLNVDARQLEDKGLLGGITFSLASEAAVCQSLDDALALWKQLLSAQGAPAVRCPEQTVASLQLLASLYNLLGKPFQALETFQLLRSLCSALGDSLGTASALCQLTRLLCQLQCASYAQLFLAEAESSLQSCPSGDDALLVLQQTCLLLRCQLCCATHRIQEGAALLLGLLRNPALRRSTKSWYLLRAQVLWVLGTYLSLPPALLCPQLRQQLFQQGWFSPKAALLEAQKLFHSILLLLGEAVPGFHPRPNAQFLDCGDNVLLKWQVLAELLGCSEHLVAFLSGLDLVCRGKAFCLDAARLAVRLQSPRWSVSFLVLKSQLELQQQELELGTSDLQQALLLLESTQDPAEAPGVPTEPKAPRKRSPDFLGHPASCPCPLCSDPTLALLGLRWLLCQGRALLAAGEVEEGLTLLRATLTRRVALGARLGARLEGVLGAMLPPGSLPAPLPAPGLLDEPVASVYATLALSSPCPEEELEEGLRFLASCSPSLPSLALSRATLLLGKALARLGWQRDPARAIWEGSGDWQQSGVPRGEPQGAAVPPTPEVPQDEPQKPQTRARVAKKSSAVPGAGTARATADPEDEVPPVASCSPRGKASPSAKARRAPRSRMASSRSSPLSTKSWHQRAPRATSRAKVCLKITFSDDSDQEEPPVPSDPSCAHRAAAPTPPGHRQARGRGVGATQPCRKGSGTRCSRGTRERRLVPPSSPHGALAQQRGNARGRRGQRKVEKDPEKALGASQIPEHQGDSGRRQLAQQQEVPAEQQTGTGGTGGTGDPLPPKEEPPALPLGAGEEGNPSLHQVLEILQDSFNCISHCPPSALYGQLCQLLAQALGAGHPLLSAYLLSEPLSVSTRHQLLSNLSRKIHKEKLPLEEVSKQLQGLSLVDGACGPRRQQLAQLQSIFSFSSTELGAGGTEDFQRQLQQIPHGVTVCVLSVSSTRPGSLESSTLLLSRLEKGTVPVNIRVPPTKVSLQWLLGELSSIQREQREANQCWEKREWWLRRFQLDSRMQKLIEALERDVLGFWRGALLPTQPQLCQPQLVARLLPQLQRCGWREPDPALLQVLLNGAAILSPAELRALASSLCPLQARQAQQLLQRALPRAGGCSSAGTLVLLLDKHLQQLPWESISCLQPVAVTRLPSLHFVLSYALAQQQPGSVLSRGVDPARTFYVLNPQGNLQATEERLRGLFESQPGWKGVRGVTPTTEQMQEALRAHDLYIYSGHGAGASLLDGQTLSRLECRAVALLFGCSSAALSVQGTREGMGIVLKYMMAGCPLFLGNLWDVTDGDIDRLSRALLQGWLGEGQGTPFLPHLARARQAPRLKFLTGAAPVVYGFPVCLQ